MVKPKNKLKPILPSLREKKRYIAFEVISKNPLKEFLAVYTAITNSSADLLGKIGLAKAGIRLLKEKWNEERQRGILRVNHRYVDQLRASLALIKNIDGGEVIVRSIGMSGILKKATNKYLIA